MIFNFSSFEKLNKENDKILKNEQLYIYIMVQPKP